MTADVPAPGATEQAGHEARWRRLLRWTAGILAVVLLLLAVAGYAAYRYYDSRVERIGIPDLSGDQAADEGAETFLLVGVDSREGLTPEQLAEIGTEQTDEGRTLTDTIILVYVPRDGSAARFVSFPRDSWVQIPGFGMGKINSAYDQGETARRGGGPVTTVRTVELLSGLDVDHYVEVGFEAFLNVTRAVGGVEVNLCSAVQEPDSGIDLPAGRQRISGAAALSFVRQRQGLDGQDLGRIGRQQYFLGALSREVLSAGTLLRPARVKGLLDAVTNALTVDEGLSTPELLGLARRVRGLQPGAVQFQTVPIADADGRREGQSVVLLDDAALPAFFAEVTGEAPPTPASPTPVPTPSASPDAEPTPSPDEVPTQEPRTAADQGCID